MHFSKEESFGVEDGGMVKALDERVTAGLLKLRPS